MTDGEGHSVPEGALVTVTTTADAPPRRGRAYTSPVPALAMAGLALVRYADGSSMYVRQTTITLTSRKG